MTPEERRSAMRALGGDLPGRDLDCYATNGKDACEPIVGEGDPRARICLFGRDPGKDEVRHGVPFVGAGGQKLRAGLHRALFGGDPPDFAASLRAGTFAFWANTVPFKPIDNKAWSLAVRKAFRPLVADVLLSAWQGHDVLTLGQQAFEWFGLDAPKDVQAALATHWEREDRFETSVEVELRAGGLSRRLRLHPLPHPSPLNATWIRRFPGLLDARLRALGWDADHWRLEET